MKSLRLTELFYSLQGEGYRAGQPSVFVRLSGCSAKYACAASGVQCDTEFESGQDVDVDDLVRQCFDVGKACPWIVWTGGEPADQLTDDIVQVFKGAGFLQQIETSGIRPVPLGLDWTTVSPKVAEHVLTRNFSIRPDGFHVDELKYVRHPGQSIPQPSLLAKVKCLSPHNDGDLLNRSSLQHCIRLCLDHPDWRLSMQQHKVWTVR